MKEHPRRMLVIEEKHGNCYYHVPTNVELHKAAIRIIKSRIAYYPGPESMTEDDRQMSLGQTEMPLSDKELAQRIIDRELGPLAVRFLRDRVGSEYEGFEFDLFEDLTEACWVVNDKL